MIQERTVDLERLAKPKNGERNSGRTFDLLFRAVKEHDKATTFVFVGSGVRLKAIVDDLSMICNHLGRFITRSYGETLVDIDGSPFQFWVASGATGKGSRSRFFIDHAVYDRLSWNECMRMHANIMSCDADFAPPQGIVE